MRYLDNKFRAISVLTAALILAGCASTPYERPAIDMPATWTHGAAKPARSDQALVAQLQADPWWQAAHDEQLNALQTMALQRNADLAVAGWNVRNAWLAAGNAMGNRLPSASGSLSGSTSREVDGTGSWQKSYGSSLGASWQVDLWGNLAAQQSQAEWEAKATEQDRLAAGLTLTGMVATTYWQLAVAQQKLQSQKTSLERARKTLQLVQVQRTAGAVSGLELAQAQQTVANQESTLAQLQQNQVQLQNSLAILLNVAPDQLPSAAWHARLPDAQTLPTVPAGVPADVLARRPDLQAAEMRLRASLANVDATRTSFYPTLSLTGGLTGGGSSLLSILSNPVAALGASVSLPFLNAGQMKRNIATSENSYQKAIETFRQTLLKAFADVETALSNRTQLQTQQTKLVQVQQDASRVEALTAIRYRSGAIALRDWLTAQESLRSAEMAVLDGRLAQWTNWATLHQTLGGSPVVAELASTGNK